jgi:hypothetical protein
MREYAALGFDRAIRPPVSGHDRIQPSRQPHDPGRLAAYGNSQGKDIKQRVDARLACWAETGKCVRMYKLKKAIDSTPPHILRDARLRAAMWSWLETKRSLGR